MGENDLMQAVEKHLDLSDTFLKSARWLVDDGDLRSAIDRAYYAMHHAAQAALISRGFEASNSHKHLISQFGEVFVKTGDLEKELGRNLNLIFRQRQESTYEIYGVYGSEGTEKTLNQAEEFVSKIKEFVRSSA